MTTATATTETLREIATLSGSRVDRSAGVVRGVKLIGQRSKNGRTYTEQALRNAVKMYEGAKVNFDHGPKDTKADRSYRDRFGSIHGVRFRDGALYGDLHFNPKHPIAEQFLWDAEHNPNNLGFSHVAQGRTVRRDGQTVVEEITSVCSVDIVSDPATTGGLFESVVKDMKADYPSDQKAFASALTAPSYAHLRNPFRLREADDMGGVEEMPIGDPSALDSRGDRIAKAIRSVAARKDIDIETRSQLILELAGLDAGPRNADFDAKVEAILAKLPSEGEVNAMGSAESFARCVTSPSGGYGGIRLTEAKGQRTGAGKAKAGEYPKDNRSFARAIS